MAFILMEFVLKPTNLSTTNYDHVIETKQKIIEQKLYRIGCFVFLILSSIVATVEYLICVAYAKQLRLIDLRDSFCLNRKIVRRI